MVFNGYQMTFTSLFQFFGQTIYEFQDISDDKCSQMKRKNTSGDQNASDNQHKLLQMFPKAGAEQPPHQLLNIANY